MLKIIAGLYKSQKLQQPPGSLTRPVSQKVRAAIFDVLGDRVVGATAVDLFAGSGALGFEALSRGAEFVLFVDKSPKAKRVIVENAKLLGVNSQVKILVSDAGKLGVSLDLKFDIIFIDPPYAKFSIELVNSIANLLKSTGVMVVSSSSKTELAGLSDKLTVVQHKIYGDTQIAYITKI